MVITKKPKNSPLNTQHNCQLFLHIQYDIKKPMCMMCFSFLENKLVTSIFLTETSALLHSLMRKWHHTYYNTVCMTVTGWNLSSSHQPVRGELIRISAQKSITVIPLLVNISISQYNMYVLCYLLWL